MSLPTKAQKWIRDGFLISTDKKLLSIPAINSAFDQEFVYWTRAVPHEILQQVIDNSFCFGLYKTAKEITSADGTEPASTVTHTEAADNLEQIGFARLVTDNLTFAYLTDLYVLPRYQGLGVGGWLIDCVDELLSSLPYLRWAMLRTSKVKSKESYEKRLGMSILSSEISQGAVIMGKKGKAGRT
ncbi:hypothetical protein UA08_07492 [Talaromyces atroroseus]|uniref:N-acetyltransferase domain-containing protein n=1 Tax=Talaromyces atroroseus TaxID=1441469 RepID=A0A225AQW9_TALAT|nr:hypothetical protein UA08_07492 [Talaromyces atroroseus]OKL57316.1 hypothetical protein UA08_07492 [Talaromyces atroroseus]